MFGMPQSTIISWHVNLTNLELWEYLLRSTLHQQICPRLPRSQTWRCRLHAVLFMEIYFLQKKWPLRIINTLHQYEFWLEKLTVLEYNLPGPGSYLGSETHVPAVWIASQSTMICWHLVLLTEWVNSRCIQVRTVGVLFLTTSKSTHWFSDSNLGDGYCSTVINNSPKANPL